MTKVYVKVAKKEDGSIDLDKLSLDDASILCNNGHITIEEFRDLVQKRGAEDKFWITSDRNPKYPPGNNKSRNGFTWNHVHNLKGKYLQEVWKKVIIKAIDYIYGELPKKYDKECYKYDDERLIELDKFMTAFIKENFTVHVICNYTFMNKIKDIVLAIAKEDIYYRARMFYMINQFMGKERFPLTLDEIQNIQRFH